MACACRATTRLGVGLVARSWLWRRARGAARLIAGMTDSVMTRCGGSLGRLSTSSWSLAPLTPCQGSGLSLRARPWLILLLLVCGHRARRSLAPRRDPCRRGLGGGVVAVRQRLRLLLPPPQPVRAFRTVPGLRWTGRASGTLGSRPASAPKGANCLRGCCMTRRAGTRRERATTTSTLNTGGRRALSDRAACGGSVDRFLHVWASFRIHTGNWDVRLMYLWGEQSQGTPQLASTVVCFVFWHPRWSRTLPQ